MGTPEVRLEAALLPGLYYPEPELPVQGDCFQFYFLSIFILAWFIIGVSGLLLLSEGWGDNKQYTHSKTKEQETSYLEPSIISWVDMCSVTQLYLTLCDPMDYSPPGSSAHGIFQVRILEWGASSYFSWPRDQICISCVYFTVRQITASATWEAHYTIITNK